VPSGAQPDYVLFSHGGAMPFSSPGPTGYTPAQVRHAYGFDRVSYGGGTVPGDGSGTTIAIVDAFDDPNIAGDLQQFDRRFGLPDPAFSKVDQTGGNNLPPADHGWAREIALDVEWAHAIAPGACILLVEANDNFPDNLLTAVSFAANQPGVVAVSMSFGGQEFPGETAFDSTFQTPAGQAGVTFVASSGDFGAPPSYPAASPNVLAVGGTTLNLDTSGNILSESGWAGSGGGLSPFEPQPAYQFGVVTQSSTQRANPDVAYDADPNTGFPIYDTFNNSVFAPWSQVGGTSAGAPQWAALVAIADQGLILDGVNPLDGPTQTLPELYALPAGDFHDITTGGSTGFPPLSAGPGYDLVTGLGTPVVNRIITDLVGPSIVTPAHVLAQTSTTAALNVLGNDPAGEASLTYTWSAVAGPASVSFGPNGTHDAQNSTATFTRAGTYALQVTLTDPAGLTITSQVTVVVNQVVSSISVTPATASVPDGGWQQFTATGRDQFGQALTSPAVTWSVDAGGLGTVNAGGLYAAPASGTGSATVRASSGAVSGTAAVTVTAGPFVSITMYQTPTSPSYPIGITAGPDGNMWFTEDLPSKIGRITPAGVITEFALPPPLSQNDAGTRGPSAITLGPDGNLWFTETFGPYNSIGKISPIAPYTVTEYVIPTVNSTPESITRGPDGYLWFTEINGHKIGRISPSNGAMTEFTVSSSPVSIALGPDGNLWFTESGTHNIGRINPWTGVVNEYLVPIDPYSACSGITAGADGNMWFGVVGYGIGRINPFTGDVTEFALPAAGVFWGSPTGLAVGPDNNIWFGTVYGSDVVGRITPGGAFTQYVVSSPDRNVEWLATGPDGNLWFTEDPTRIGRITLSFPSAPNSGGGGLAGPAGAGSGSLLITGHIIGTGMNPPPAVAGSDAVYRSRASAFDPAVLYGPDGEDLARLLVESRHTKTSSSDAEATDAALGLAIRELFLAELHV
jgi:streptogramin lyase